MAGITPKGKKYRTIVAMAFFLMSIAYVHGWVSKSLAVVTGLTIEYFLLDMNVHEYYALVILALITPTDSIYIVFPYLISTIISFGDFKETVKTTALLVPVFVFTGMYYPTGAVGKIINIVAMLIAICSTIKVWRDGIISWEWFVLYDLISIITAMMIFPRALVLFTTVFLLSALRDKSLPFIIGEYHDVIIYVLTVVMFLAGG